MPCSWMKLADGTVVHVNHGHRRPAKCSSCGRNPHTKLCDFKFADGSTCDAKLCDQCSRPMGEEDFCPKHSGGNMGEHFTRNTETATAWCAKCGRLTEHRIDGGRKGPCIDPRHPKPAEPKPAKTDTPTQRGLF